jgi:hypothetical protein
MRTTASNQYLPDELRMYGGTFDRHGAWYYEQPYGYVWYPRVAFDWRPYYHGYWSSIRRYGWTWIGLEVWSWPTHHYGRWGHARNRWFWIPKRHFGAAWVWWGAAPGYVTWCPLGFDDRPVHSLSATTGIPSIGWVIVPRTRFGRHLASRWAVAPDPSEKTTPFAALAPVPVPPAPRAAVPRAIVASGSSADDLPVPGNSAAGGQVAPGAGPAPVVVAPRPATDRRTRVANQRSSRASAGPSDAQSRSGTNETTTPDDRTSATGNPREAVRKSGPPPTVPLSIDRAGTSAIRPPSAERPEPPGRSAQPIDLGDRQVSQPFPQARPYPQSQPPVQARPAAERNPGPPAPRSEAPTTGSLEPHRPAPPREGRPGEPAARPSTGDGARPAAPASSGAPPSAAPRSRSGGESTSRPPAAPQEPARPAAPSASPRVAMPRSEPPRSSAPSAPASSAPQSRSREDGGGSQGGRQRRP